ASASVGPGLSEQRAGERLEVILGARAIMLDHLGGGDGAEAQRVFKLLAARRPEQEASGEQVARAGRVDERIDGLGGYFGALATPCSERPLLAPGDDQSLDPWRNFGNCSFEVGDAGKGLDLRLIGKEDVDSAVVQQLVEAAAVSV